MTYDKIHDLFKKGYDQKSWKQFLGETFAKARLLARAEDLTGIDGNVAKKALKLGHLLLDENGIERQIAVYEVTLGKGIVLERNRVGLRNLLRKHWKDIDAAFIVYHNPDNNKWRFTYVSELTGYDADGEFVKIKTEPKRYTYVLGEGESTRTAAERFAIIAKKGSNATLEDVKDAFSVEKLSKEFFSEYKKHYDVICSFMLKKPGIKQTIFKGDEKEIRDFSKKLLGRIVFLYFIQKKGWLGVPKKGKWGEGDLQFMSNLYNKQKSKDLFYSQTLSKLFFDTLNTKRKDDLTELVKDVSCRIPYLNGGLFEEDDKNYRNIFFDSNIFENLFNFFNQYNFTIYEDDPNDHTIAVDPEMLGHIFENLLEDNKDKGAYYTPKEIVHYMCQESLIEYLTTWFENKGYDIEGYAPITEPNKPGMFPVNEKKEGQTIIEIPVGGKKIDRTLIEKLLKKKLDEEDRQMVKEHSKEFHEALDKVKICDPAIGSGAFPMGLLQEIFTAKQTLHFFKYGSLTRFPASEVKLNIIQNSIYGVDIEKGAVDIARLRFWLSLVVDEEEPKPLPNLDYKIVVGNSLVSKLGDEIIDIDWNIDTTEGGMFVQQRAEEVKDILDKIFAEQKEFFNPDCDKMKLAKEIRDLKIKLLISQLELMVAKANKEKAPKRTDYKDNKNFVKAHELYMQTIGWKENIRQLKELSKKPNEPLHFFDWKLDFPEVMNEQVADKVGFDIVIGNPPYVQLQKDDGKLAKEFSKLKYETFKKSGDIYTLFYEKGIQLIKSGGLLVFITSNKWMRAEYGLSTRSLFCKNNPLKIIDLGSGIFPSAVVDTNILFIEKSKNRGIVYGLDISKEKELGDFERFISNWIILKDLGDEPWVLFDDLAKRVLTKLNQFGTPLKELDIQINYGIKTGFNDAFIITTEIRNTLCKLDRKNEKLIKPILRGRDIKRYVPEWAGLWLINTHNGVKEKNLPPVNVKKDYPHVYKFLKKFEAELKMRKDKGDQWTNLRSCTYIYEFEKEKIIYPNMTLYLPFIYDSEFYYTNQKCFILTKNIRDLNLKYIVGYLNSKVSHMWIRNNCPELQGGTRELSKVFFENIPVPKSSAKNQRKIEILVTRIMSLKSKGKDTSALEQEIDNMVYRLYDLTYDDVKVIDPVFGLTKEEYEAIRIG